MPTNRPTTKQLLKDLVSFYPVSSDQDSVLKVLTYVKDHLAKIGLRSEILTNKGVHMLYSSTTGSKHAKIMLQAHVDVVPAKLEQTRLKTVGDKVYGRGVRDMLFATASYIRFFYDHADELDSLDLSICLSGDEELGGSNSVPWLLNQGYSADVVWLPDAGNSPKELVTSAKGGYNFDITVSGQSHHGSRPWEGDGAAGKLVSLLSELRSGFKVPSENVSTMTITQLESGDSINKGPATARAHIDIRFTDQTELERCRQLVAGLCQRYRGTVSNLLTMPNYSVDCRSELVKLYLKVNKSVTGQPAEPKSVCGSSDARFFSQKGIPVVMTRPISKGSHGDNEWLSLSSFDEYHRVMELYTLQVASII
jgi:succinyl-diaminopimelate desuccinylase